MDVFWTWPPVTRTLIAATVTTSLLLWTGVLPFYHFVFIRQQILQMPPKIPEIWRAVTPFFIASSKIGILMDPYFIFTYGSPLERESSRFREPGSFFVYLVFLMSVILLTSGFYLGDALLLEPLILAFAYTFAQENPNANVSMYFITFPAKYLPFALLFLTLVLASPTAAMHQATGLIAAHLYDFLTRIWPTFGGGTNYITTPNIVKNWFIEPGPSRPQPRGYGTVYEPGQRATADNSSWSHQRGPGRRLGGE